MVGQARIPLAHLQSVGEGSVLEEGILSYYPKVRAVSNGCSFAEGELVTIGERVGFRVTKILI